jgi:outer membrane lipoprotein SlyB
MQSGKIASLARKIPAPDTFRLAPPRETPAESPFTTWLGSLFTPPASAAVPPLAEPDGIVWGAGALAAMAGMSAYFLSKRREEEEAQRRAVREQVAAKNDALRAKEAQMREQAKIENYLQGKAMLEAALKDSNLSDAEKANIKEHSKTNGMEAEMKKTMLSLTPVLTLSVHRREKKDDVSPDGVTIPPLSHKQYIEMNNLNTAAQVGVYGVTAGTGAMVGAVIGLKVGGPVGMAVGAVIGAIAGTMWGAYEANCLTSVQSEFDKAYQHSTGVQVWREGLAYNIYGGGESYTHVNAPLSVAYVAITTFVLTGKFP